MIRLIHCSVPTALILLSHTALAAAQPMWVESGVNFIWDPAAGNLDPALTIGCGQETSDIANYCLAPQEHYAALPLVAGTPNDGGQYFCYSVHGWAPPNPVQNFNPTNYSFQCSQVSPFTDNNPGSLLIGGNDGGLAGDAGFLGSIFRQDAGGSVWQPWFRNGDEVLFDMTPPTTFAWGVAPLGGVPPVTLTSIDPSFYEGTVSFINAGPFVQTVPLPNVFSTGYIVELQIGNFYTGPAAPATLPPAQIRILSKDATGTTQWIGEATTGPINCGAANAQNPGAGFPRIASYHIDFSDQLWTSTITGLTLDMSSAHPAVNQKVVVSVILHGYHEQLLK